MSGRSRHRLPPAAPAWGLLAVLLLPAAASAHALRFATAHLRIAADGSVRGALREGAHLTVRQAVLRLRGPDCRPVPGEHLRPAGPGLWRLHWRCRPEAGPLRLQAERLPAGARIHLQWEGSGGGGVALLGPGEQAVLREGAERGTSDPRSPFPRYLAMGVEHILEGADHLAFVLLLTMLVGGWRQLLATVTSFTLGHSVTLAIAALGAAPPSAPVEALVALSIVLAAREAMLPEPSGLLGRRPPLAAGAFGLLHGLAFAGALREVGLPPGATVAALLGFNVGVEIGQLLFVGAVMAATALLGLGCRSGACATAPREEGRWWRPLPAPTRRAAAALVGAWAAFLFFERGAAVVHAQPETPPQPAARHEAVSSRSGTGTATIGGSRSAPATPGDPAGRTPAVRAEEAGRRASETSPATDAPPEAGGALDPFALPPSRSTSLGSPSDGSLRGGVPVPAGGPGFLADPRKDPRNRHGTVEVVRAVVRALGVVAAELPGGVAWVGDLSAPEGGPLDGHRTHQAGRDVDLSFYVLDAAGRPRSPVVTFFDERGRAVDFRDLEDPSDDVPLRLDVPRTWRLVRALLEHPDPDARVQRILLAAHLHALLRAEAERTGAAPATVERFEQVSCQPRWAPHDDHLHVRFFCSAEDLRLGCRDLRPLFAWREAELRAAGVEPRLARRPRRRGRRRPRVRSVAEARAAAGPMHPEVTRWLDRREAWMRSGARVRPCRATEATVSPERHAAP